MRRILLAVFFAPALHAAAVDQNLFANRVGMREEALAHGISNYGHVAPMNIVHLGKEAAVA